MPFSSMLYKYVFSVAFVISNGDDVNDYDDDFVTNASDWLSLWSKWSYNISNYLFMCGIMRKGDFELGWCPRIQTKDIIFRKLLFKVVFLQKLFNSEQLFFKTFNILFSTTVESL